MGHYAKVVDNKVVNVIVAEADFFDDFIDTSAGRWIQTSYNTHGGVHLQGGTALRGNYAGIGFVYDPENDVFYEPQPFPSWTLNTTTWTWEPPIALPSDADTVVYEWNEADQTWDAV